MESFLDEGKPRDFFVNRSAKGSSSGLREMTPKGNLELKERRKNNR